MNTSINSTNTQRRYTPKNRVSVMDRETESSRNKKIGGNNSVLNRSPSPMRKLSNSGLYNNTVKYSIFIHYFPIINYYFIRKIPVVKQT